MASPKVLWFLDASIRPHLEKVNSPLLNIKAQPDAALVAAEMPIARHDRFEKIPRELLDSIAENYFLGKYHSSSPYTNSSAAESTFHHHDHSFEWMKEKLEDHEDSGKGITYWECEICYDIIIETFGFSIKLATAALDVFIRSHTRCMHVDRLDTSISPSIKSVFPLEKLQHLTLYIPTAPINKHEYKRINALTEEIPQLHLSFPGLTSLNIEINWAKRFGPSGGPPSTNLDPEYVYYLHRDMFELCLELNDAAKHIQAVALQSGERIMFGEDFEIDWVAMEKALQFPFTQTQER
jgi:hypothetical protein